MQVHLWATPIGAARQSQGLQGHLELSVRLCEVGPVALSGTAKNRAQVSLPGAPPGPHLALSALPGHVKRPRPALLSGLPGAARLPLGAEQGWQSRRETESLVQKAHPVSLDECSENSDAGF